jgi:uncharacterized protein
MRNGTATTDVHLGGPLGEALDANLQGRLTHFIVDETSPAIALFAPERRALNTEGDWYGEHAGKWLVAAAKAVARSGDPAHEPAPRRRLPRFRAGTRWLSRHIRAATPLHAAATAETAVVER